LGPKEDVDEPPVELWDAGVVAAVPGGVLVVAVVVEGVKVVVDVEGIVDVDGLQTPFSNMSLSEEHVGVTSGFAGSVNRHFVLSVVSVEPSGHLGSSEV
jgi:hypothetical protein